MPDVSFPDHTALLTELLKRHDAIVVQIETRLLNVQGKDTAPNRSRDYFDRIFNSCFYETPGLPRALSELKGQLHASHVADGFEPVVLDGAAHTLDPLELTLRAYDIWERARWPGRNGRLSYARVLFGVFILRQLEALSLRIWDDGNALAGDRLRHIQEVLDRLNDLLDPNVLIRDARWLIQTAQGLEDVFVTRVDLENKVHVDGSPDWAGQMFQRTVEALELRAHSTDANATEVPGARMFIVPGGRKVDSIEGLPAGIVPAQQYCLTSDVSQALADGTTAFPRSQILADRNEGRFLERGDRRQVVRGVEDDPDGGDRAGPRRVDCRCSEAGDRRVARGVPGIDRGC